MKLNFKQFIDKSGLTQTQIAKELNVSYPTINNLYNGTAKSIYFDKLEELCNLLHCTPNDVLDIGNQNKDTPNTKISTEDIYLTLPDSIKQLVKSEVHSEIKTVLASLYPKNESSILNEYAKLSRMRIVDLPSDSNVENIPNIDDFLKTYELESVPRNLNQQKSNPKTSTITKKATE